jgi:hypothetical protein
MTTATPVSGTTRHVVRDIVVLGTAVLCTAGAMTGLSLVVGSWA